MLRQRVQKGRWSSGQGWGGRKTTPVSLLSLGEHWPCPTLWPLVGAMPKGVTTQPPRLHMWLQWQGNGVAGSSDSWPPTGLRRVMLRAHRQAWCWQDEWTELSMADIRALEEETARMLAQRMAKCNTGSEGPEAQLPGKPSTEARPGANNISTPDGPEAPPGPDASPDASFGKQWSSSSRSSYSSQHGGEAGAQAPWWEGTIHLRLGSQAEGCWPCRGRVSPEPV